MNPVFEIVHSLISLSSYPYTVLPAGSGNGNSDTIVIENGGIQKLVISFDSPIQLKWNGWEETFDGNTMKGVQQLCHRLNRILMGELIQEHIGFDTFHMTVLFDPETDEIIDTRLHSPLMQGEASLNDFFTHLQGKTMELTQNCWVEDDGENEFFLQDEEELEDELTDPC